MMDYSREGAGFLKGALIGGVLAGVAGLLLAPKSGKETRDDISDGYCQLNKQVRKLTNGRFGDIEVSDGSTSFLTGGVVGSVLGIVAAFLLAPSSGDQLRKELGDSYEDVCDRAEDFLNGVNAKGRMAAENIEEWKDTVVSVLEKLSCAVGSKKSSSKIREFVDIANLGVKLWHKFQDRR